MLNLLHILLINQSDIVTTLIVVLVVFSILLIIGIRKSYKLKKENDRLNNMKDLEIDDNKPYRDFTEGHMYDNNNYKEDD